MTTKDETRMITRETGQRGAHLSKSSYFSQVVPGFAASAVNPPSLREGHRVSLHIISEQCRREMTATQTHVHFYLGELWVVFWSKITGFIDGLKVEVVGGDQVSIGLYEGMDVRNKKSSLHGFENLGTFCSPESERGTAVSALTQQCAGSLRARRRYGFAHPPYSRQCYSLKSPMLT